MKFKDALNENRNESKGILIKDMTLSGTGRGPANRGRLLDKPSQSFKKGEKVNVTIQDGSLGRLVTVNHPDGRTGSQFSIDHEEFIHPQEDILNLKKDDNIEVVGERGYDNTNQKVKEINWDKNEVLPTNGPWFHLSKIRKI